MPKKQASSIPGAWFSIAAHSCILLLLLLSRHQIWNIRTIQVRGGEHTILYWQRAAIKVTTRKAAAPKPQPARKPVNSRQPESVPASEPHPGQNGGASDFGGAQAGSEDIAPAYPIFSPSPHIADRSLLPSASQNVIVDVNVSERGDVLGEKLVQGLGSSLDQIVLDTVKTWKFHPASSNGNPVASVAELIFPLSKKWTG